MAVAMMMMMVMMVPASNCLPSPRMLNGAKCIQCEWQSMSGASVLDECAPVSMNRCRKGFESCNGGRNGKWLNGYIHLHTITAEYITAYR